MLQKNYRMKLNNALIGHTGFIGSNLIKVKPNLIKFNSKNIGKIKSQKFNTVICAGTYSKIWLAKKNPKKDFNHIQKLIKNLKLIKVKKFILISTCEVYRNHKTCNEKTNIIKSKLSNYGLNRLYLEEFVQKKFLDHHMIRLPIVYGKGFSKNFLFDLMNKKNLHNLNGNDLVQIYNVKNLKKDIQFVVKKKIKLINISSRPIKVSKIAKENFKTSLKKNKNFRVINMKSIYGKKNKYFISNKKSTTDLEKFLKLS